MSISANTKVTAAIVVLEQHLEMIENNEPINRKEGNIEQADLEAANAVEIRMALSVLKYWAVPEFVEQGKEHEARNDRQRGIAASGCA